MKRLPKPVVQRFERPQSSPVIPTAALENEGGQLFLGINEPSCPNDFHLYLWQEDGSWQLIFSTPGLSLGGGASSHFHFDDPQAQCLVFTLHEPGKYSRAVLLTVSYDGLISRRITAEGNLSHVSRFPGGDFLLFGDRWSGTAPLLFFQRLSSNGVILWEHSQVREPGPASLSGQWQLAHALSDQTTLLYTEINHTCHLMRLGQDGTPLPTPALETLSLSIHPLPQVREEGDGWTVEDVLTEYGTDSPLPPHHFHRAHFDQKWNLTAAQSASLPSSILPGFTFYPDGVLVGQARTHRLDNGQFSPCCQINWLDLSTGQSTLLLVTREFTPPLAHPSFGLPLFRLEDGSFLFSLDVANANAKGVLLGVSSGGQITWAKKYRCEGNRWLFLKKNQLVAVFADFQAVRAETYRLPSPDSKEV